MDKFSEDTKKVNNRRIEAKIAEINGAGSNLYEVKIKLDNPMQFEAGQYVWLVLPNVPEGKRDREAFSLTSAEGFLDEIEISTRDTNSQYKKQLLSLKPNDKVVIYGPHGSSFCVPNEQSDTEYLFLAGGVGVSPFLSILRSIPGRVNRPKMTLIYNRSDEKSDEYGEELRQIAANSPNVNVIFKTGELGVTNISELSGVINAKTVVFVSGPQEYVNVADGLFRHLIKKPQKIHYEQFYPISSEVKAQVDQLLRYVDEVTTEKTVERISIRQLDIFNSIRKSIFSILLVFSLIATPALIFAHGRHNYEFQSSLNILLLAYLIIQLVNTTAYYIWKKINVNLLVAVSSTAVTFVLFNIFDQSVHMKKPWLLLPILLFFFFYSLRKAFVLTAGYFITLTTAYAFYFSANHRPPEIDFLTVTIFVINTVIVMVIIVAIAQLIKRSEQLKNDRIGAFNVIMRAVSESTSHIVITDVNGMILFANQAARRNTGFSTDEMVGQTPRLWGGLQSPKYYQDFWFRKDKGDVLNEIIVNRNKKGEIYYIRAHISPIRGENNQIIGFLATEDNITDLKESEEKIRESKAIDEVMLTSIADGLIATDQKGIITLVNPAFENILGWKANDVVGRRLVDVVQMTDDTGNLCKTEERLIPRVLKDMKPVVDSGAKINYVKKDGSSIPVSVSISPIIIDDQLIGTIEVFRDITNERAIDKAKSEFVSLASHQLRTPLSSINWYAEMLINGDAGKLSKTQTDYIRQVYAANERMVALINDLLNVSRLELGTFAIDAEEIDVKKAAQQIVEETETITKKRSQKLEIKFGAKLPKIVFDKKYLEMIYQNLLSNASKYSPEKTTIKMNVDPVSKGDTIDDKLIHEDGVMIVVADSGFGIPKNQQNKIFSKLFRADNAREKDADGSGLGLYVIKSFIDHCHGMIWFKSAQDKGTTFYVFLPLVTAKKDGDKKLQ